MVEEKYLDFEKGGAYATSFLLTFVSVVCIVVVSIIRPKGKTKTHEHRSCRVSGRRFGDFVALEE